MAIRLHTPLSEQDMRSLRAGDIVELSGYLYTGRVASLAEGAREAGLKF